MLIGIDASRAAYHLPTGTENYSSHLIRALLGLGTRHRFVLYSSRPLPPELTVPGPQVECRRLYFPRLWTHVRLSAEMLLHPPDLLWVPAHVLPIVHPRCSVVTIHDLGYLHFPEAHRSWSRWYLRWSTRHNAQSAKHIIVDSLATRSDLQALGIPASKTTVIYPGCDPSFNPIRDPNCLETVRTRYGVAGPFFLHVGTIQPRKNLGHLVDAFAQLASEHPRVQLVLAGKRGWQSGQLLDHIAKVGLTHRIRLIGYVPQTDLPSLMSAAVALVMPSLYEGFGLPVLEAMACGTPVICSNTSSLPEVAGDAGLLVDPQRTDSLSSAMRRVQGDGDLRRELIQRGLAQAARFSWQSAARQTLQVLESAYGTGVSRA